MLRPEQRVGKKEIYGMLFCLSRVILPRCGNQYVLPYTCLQGTGIFISNQLWPKTNTF